MKKRIGGGWEGRSGTQVGSRSAELQILGAPIISRCDGKQGKGPNAPAAHLPHQLLRVVDAHHAARVARQQRCARARAAADLKDCVGRGDLGAREAAVGIGRRADDGHPAAGAAGAGCLGRREDGEEAALPHPVAQRRVTVELHQDSVGGGVCC
jgi:hypothetical protein